MATDYEHWEKVAQGISSDDEQFPLGSIGTSDLMDDGDGSSGPPSLRDIEDFENDEDGASPLVNAQEAGGSSDGPQGDQPVGGPPALAQVSGGSGSSTGPAGTESTPQQIAGGTGGTAASGPRVHAEEVSDDDEELPALVPVRDLATDVTAPQEMREASELLNRITSVPSEDVPKTGDQGDQGTGGEEEGSDAEPPPLIPVGELSEGESEGESDREGPGRGKKEDMVQSGGAAGGRGTGDKDAEMKRREKEKESLFKRGFLVFRGGPGEPIIEQRIVEVSTDDSSEPDSNDDMPGLVPTRETGGDNDEGDDDEGDGEEMPELCETQETSSQDDEDSEGDVFDDLPGLVPGDHDVSDEEMDDLLALPAAAPVLGGVAGGGESIEPTADVVQIPAVTEDDKEDFTPPGGGTGVRSNVASSRNAALECGPKTPIPKPQSVYVHRRALRCALLP